MVMAFLALTFIVYYALIIAVTIWIFIFGLLVVVFLFNPLITFLLIKNCYFIKNKKNL